MKPTIKHVRQIDKEGCGLACYAMLTGRTYAEAKAIPAFRNKNWEKGGIDHNTLESCLADEHVALARKYINRVGLCLPDHGRQDFGWPPALFADVHLGMFRTASNQHFVVILRDGSVLDPMRDESSRYESCCEPDKWAFVAGVAWMPERWGVA